MEQLHVTFKSESECGGLSVPVAGVYGSLAPGRTARGGIMKLPGISFVIFVLFAFCGPAFGDLTLNAVTRSGKQVVERGRITVSQGRVRVDEAPGATAPLKPAMILHTVREEATAVDHSTRTCTVVSLATMKDLSGHFDNFLNLLPEEHRAGVEGWVREPAVAVTVQPTGRTLEIEGVTCRGLILLRGGQPAYEVWMAPEASFADRAPDLRTLRKALHYLSEFSRLAPGMAGEEAALAALEKVAGVPRRIRSLTVPGRVMEIRTDPGRVEPGFFQPPEGYRLQTGPIPGV